MSPPTPAEAKDIISTWLASFSDAVERADARAVAATLQPHGWLRDVLTFTWDTRSLSGREAVESYLSKSGSLANAQISKIALDTDPHLPSQLGFGPAGPGVEVWFTYEARYVTGKGSAFLQKDEQGAWRALTLATIATELKGHEELAELDWEASGKTWGEFEEERIRSIEENPYVLVGEGTRRAYMIGPRSDVLCSWCRREWADGCCSFPPNEHPNARHRAQRTGRRQLA